MFFNPYCLMEEYIGSQQHFEDCINEHYDREEEMNRQMEKDIQKQIYQQIQEPVFLCATIIDKTGEHCPETGIHQIEGTNDFLCDKCFKVWNNKHKSR